MNKEQEYLIQLTAAYAAGEKANPSAGIDCHALMKLAVQHNLFGVAYCALKNSGCAPEEIIEEYQNGFVDTIYNSNLQMKVFCELKEALSARKIRYVPFKGVLLREIYPVPETRTMGDIDVLIDPQNKSEARKALEAAGFTCVNSNGPVWDYDKNGVRAEVHTSILNGKAGSGNAPAYFANAMEKAEFSGFEGKLPPQYHFEYLIAHIAHHFCFYGAGIRMILDLAFMLKTYGIDPARTASRLDKAGLGEFARVILTVCQKWYNTGADFDKDTRQTEEFLTAHGAFGFHSRNYSAVVERKALEDGKRGGKLKSRVRLLFPSYSKMKEIPYIKFIENKPYLTPYAWVYRFFYNLKHRQSFMMTTVKGLGSEEAERKARQELEFFKEIGLL